MKEKKIKVVILSDRLLDEAKVLAGYLRCTGRVEIVGIARNRRQVLSLVLNHTFDYLIIAGYLKVESTYNVIAELQLRQIKFLPVQWAILDELIFTLCHRYNISLKFDRTLPMMDFVSYLEQARS